MKIKAIHFLNKCLLVSILLIFTLTLSMRCSSQNNIQLIKKEDQVDIIYNGQIVTSYLHGNHLLKPCLYPVKSTSGEIVTRSYPFKKVEGESTDHKHHTGAYFTYGSKDEVNGDGYWNTKDGTNKIQHVKIIDAGSANGKGKLLTLSHWINSNKQPILKERRLMEFHSFSDDEYKIDFTIHLFAIDTLVTFKDTKEGMFAIRVADWLAENAKGNLYKSTGEYLNAQGERTEKNIWGKQSSWVRLQGKKEQDFKNYCKQ